MASSPLPPRDHDEEHPAGPTKSASSTDGRRVDGTHLDGTSFQTTHPTARDALGHQPIQASSFMLGDLNDLGMATTTPPNSFVDTGERDSTVQVLGEQMRSEYYFRTHRDASAIPQGTRATLVEEDDALSPEVLALSLAVSPLARLSLRPLKGFSVSRPGGSRTTRTLRACNLFAVVLD
ncbi:hypothetical protein C8Q76DRAFT_790759 [Earliella scabrosa]|nr:hypothetical protein C8Q76DRAFT_790759 [Earliella scabrosa]